MITPRFTMTIAACTSLLMARGAVGQTTTPRTVKSVDVAIQIVSTSRSGGLSYSGTASSDVEAGREPITLFAFSGDTACSAGVGAGELTVDALEHFWPSKPVHVTHFWTVGVALIDASIDNINLRITLLHETRDRDGKMREAGRDVRVIRLAEREPHVLAYVEGNPAVAGTCESANAFFQLTASISDQSAQMLDYDLWLVQKNAQGNQVSQRQQRTAQQGESTTISFAPVVLQAENRSCSQEIAVSAVVRGRWRDDGRLDLSVMPRQVLESRRQMPVYRLESGRKIMSVAADEPVQFLLPPLDSGAAQCNGLTPSLIVSARPRK